MGESKILVEVLLANRVIKRKKYPIDGNAILVEKAKGGRSGGSPAYKPSFSEDSIIYYYVGKGPFKRLKQKLMLRSGSQKCMTFEKDEVEGLTKKDVEHLFDVSAITKAGATVTKVQVPMFIYVLIGVSIMVGIINLIISYRVVGYFGF